MTIGCSHAAVILALTIFKLLLWEWTTTSGAAACRHLEAQYPNEHLFVYERYNGEKVCSWTPYLELTPSILITSVLAWTLAFAVALAILYMLIAELQGWAKKTS